MVEPGTTGLPVPGTSVFFTVKFGTGFVTVDVHLFVPLHGPVILAVFFTFVVSVADTLAVKVTLTEWPAARVTWPVSFVPAVIVTEHLSGLVTEPQVGIPTSERLEGSWSEYVVVPAPDPVFLMVIV